MATIGQLEYARDVARLAFDAAYAAVFEWGAIDEEDDAVAVARSDAELEAREAAMTAADVALAEAQRALDLALAPEVDLASLVLAAGGSVVEAAGGAGIPAAGLGNVPAAGGAS